jgi:hypothetical protein
MKRNVTLGLAVAGLFMLTSAILLQQRTSRMRGITLAPPPVLTGSSEKSIAGATTSGLGALASGNVTGSASPPAGFDPSAAVDPAKRAAVATALSALSERIRTDPSPDVRLESVHVVGSIGDQAAQDLLATVATGSMELPVRQKAILELARSSGERALGVFNSLLSDSNETIRQTAVKGIARVHGERAAALLQQTATSDASAAVRELARLALPRQTAE